ncbi:SIS domain-containing protein [Methanobrevibacter sp. DSM 116169]|uniref:SIS domain-containing protein n=1 Tax=Methanobrevibacter sp. DSM 116169 TaxID=3242727 RepID=UPI0038FC0773
MWLIAKAFAMRLMQLGLNVYFIGETISPQLTTNSCLIFVSSSGENDFINLIFGEIKEKNIKSLAIASSIKSTLAKKSDNIVIISKKHDSNLTPLGTIFEIHSLIFLDDLIAELMEKLNKTEEYLKNRHESFSFADYKIV